jgi:hypothetical protein
LTNHHPLPANNLEAEGSACGVVICEKKGIESKSPAALGSQFGFALRGSDAEL